MEDAVEYECKECLETERTLVRVPDMKTLRKHVAVVHCPEEYRTYKCGRCDKLYYDFDHFVKHLKMSLKCEPIVLAVIPLDPTMQKAFDALVDQVARRLDKLPLMDHSIAAATATPASSSDNKSSSKNVDTKSVDIGTVDLDAGDGKKDGTIALESVSSSIAPAKEAKVSSKEPEPNPEAERGSEVTTVENEGGGRKQKSPDKLIRTKLQDLCQLCVDLKNERGPILALKEKESHALVHLKFSKSVAEASCSTRHPQFKKVMKMCFEPGFYEALKRKKYPFLAWF